MAYFDSDTDYLPSINTRGSQSLGLRPKPSLTYIDDVVAQKSSHAHDVWRDDKKDKHGISSRKYPSYRFTKNRPTSSGSSSSSVSSFNKESELSEDSFKLDLSSLFEPKKEQAPLTSFLGDRSKTDFHVWPQPPPQLNHVDQKNAGFSRPFTSNIGDLTLKDDELQDAHAHKEKINRLTQERDSLSLQVSHYRQAAETSASDLAAEKVKTETLSQEVRKKKTKISELEQKVMDLKCEIESGKQQQARGTAMLTALQHRVKDAEDFAVDKENKMSRVDVTIASLKKELQDQFDQKQKLETSLKHHLNVEEENSKRAANWETKFRELCAHLANTLAINAHGSIEACDLIVTKFKETVRDYNSLQQRMNSVTQSCQNTGLEVKASRETIMRLVADVGKEQKLSNERLKEIETLTRERDAATQKLRENDLELQQVKDNLKHSQEAWSSTRDKVSEQEMRLHKYDKAMHSKEQSYHKADIKLKHFKRQLAEILSDIGVSVAEKEEDILQRVRSVYQSFKEINSKDERLHSRISSLADELTNQRNLQHSTMARANNAEQQWQDSSERIKCLEGELLAADVERDRLKTDRKKFLEFIDKLSRAMKLDEVAVEAGFDISADAIVLRAEQLAKSETSSLQDRTSTIYNLQRKSKTLKQQLESKDFQLSLSKKKISEFEEILKDRSRIENERDDTSLRHQKLQRKCEKLVDELQQHKEMIVQLKAKLMEFGDLQVKNAEQKRAIEDLESVVNRLAKSKHKADRQLVEKRHALESTAKEKKKELDKRSNDYEEMERELRIAAAALQESKAREKQLLNFRQILAKLIGLDIEKLSIPDYEIISKLEKIVKAYKANAETVHSLGNTLSTMDKDFKTGYNDAMTLIG